MSKADTSDDMLTNILFIMQNIEKEQDVKKFLAEQLKSITIGKLKKGSNYIQILNDMKLRSLVGDLYKLKSFQKSSSFGVTHLYERWFKVYHGVNVSNLILQDQNLQ